MGQPAFRGTVAQGCHWWSVTSARLLGHPQLNGCHFDAVLRLRSQQLLLRRQSGQTTPANASNPRWWMPFLAVILPWEHRIEDFEQFGI